MTPEDEEFEAIMKRQLAEQEVKKPAKQRWVGLVDMEVYDLADEHLYSGGKNYGILSFYGAIEAALKEKNT